ICTNDECCGNAFGMVHLRKCAINFVTLTVKPVRLVDTFCLFKVLINRKHQENYIFMLHVIEKLVDSRHFSNAGWAPGSPNVHKDHFAFEIRHLHPFTFRINEIHLEICQWVFFSGYGGSPFLYLRIHEPSCQHTSLKKAENLSM